MALNTELANMKPLVLGEIQATDHIFVNWSVHIFVSCVFLYKDTLFNIFLSFRTVYYSAADN